MAAASSRFKYSDALKEVRNSVSKKWVKVRCPVSEIQVFAAYPSVHQMVGDQVLSHRFRGFTYLRGDFPRSAIGRAILKPDKTKTTGSALSEDAYYRENSHNLKEIIPRHNRLSNAFCDWLNSQHGVIAQQEQQRVDVVFTWKRTNILAELKVCYGVGTTKSIREALGHLLEYNFYPSRTSADVWLIVLDEKPLVDDRSFVDALRERWSLPLTLGWQTADGFAFHPNWP